MFGAFGSELRAKPGLSWRGRLAYRILGETYVGDRVRAMHVFREIPPLPRGARVLDAGSGEGAYCFYLARRCPWIQVIGVDLEHRLAVARRVQAALRITNVTLQAGDLQDLVGSEQYDLALCIGVLMYVPNDAAALACLYRALKPGGRLLVEVARPLAEAQSGLVRPLLPRGYVRDGYREPEIRAKLAGAGFSVERVRYLFGRFGSLAGELGYMLSERPKLRALLLPFLLLMCSFDALYTNRAGNGMLFVALKPVRVPERLEPD